MQALQFPQAPQALQGQQLVYLNWSYFKPEFSGKPDEDTETHNMDILKNRINIFSVQTRFCQFSNMASSGLKKTFILQYYMHKNVYQKIFSKITFFFFIMADVMPYVRLMLCLG